MFRLLTVFVLFSVSQSALAESEFKKLTERFNYLTSTQRVVLPPADYQGFYTYPYTDRATGQKRVDWIRFTQVDPYWAVMHSGDEPRTYPEIQPHQRFDQGQDFSGVLGEFKFDGKCFVGLFQTIERLGIGERPRCPQYFWWEPTRMCFADERMLSFDAAIASTEINEKCEKTQTPKPFSIPLQRRVGASFMPIRPGKYIYTLTVPPAGNNPGGFRAAFNFAWDYTDIVANAPKSITYLIVRLGDRSSVPQYRVFTTNDLAGTHQFVTQGPGRYHLVIEAYNSKNQIVHQDLLIADVPSM